MNGFTLAQLASDVATTAHLVGASCNIGLVRRCIDAFGEQFSRAAVELRTTTKAQRELSFRFVELGNPADPEPVARREGLLSSRGRGVERVLPALCERFEVDGWGVDFGAGHGLEKLWPFLKQAHSIEALFSLPGLPPAVAGNERFFERHGLRHFSIVAVDHRQESVNVYFVVDVAGRLEASAVARMLDDLGFARPALAALEYDSRAVAANLTFHPGSSAIERLCLYVPAPRASDVPADDPLLARVVEHAPIRAAQRGFIVGHTYTKRGPYTKLEIDYSGTTLACLQACVAVPRAAPGGA